MWNTLLTAALGIAGKARNAWAWIVVVAVFGIAGWALYYTYVSQPIVRAKKNELECLRSLQSAKDAVRIATNEANSARAELAQCRVDANTSTQNAYDAGYAKGLNDAKDDAKQATANDCFVIRPIF